MDEFTSECLKTGPKCRIRLLEEGVSESDLPALKKSTKPSLPGTVHLPTEVKRSAVDHHRLLNTEPIWRQLESHYDSIRKTCVIKKLFDEDPHRFKEFSVTLNTPHDGPILVDYSKNRLDEEAMQLLIDLANVRGIVKARQALFKGERVNVTEHRPVLHTTWRSRTTEPVMVAGMNVRTQMLSLLDKMEKFTGAVLGGKWVGYTGKKITHVCVIGEGTSEFGTKMVVQALKAFSRGLDIRFILNVDNNAFVESTNGVHPHSVLFIIVSRSFLSKGTIKVANMAKQWFLSSANKAEHIKKHFVAVSANKMKVTEFGIDPDYMFEYYDWINGRYAVWSGAGISISLAVGFDNYLQLMDGAHFLDEHFLSAPLEKNIPVILAVISIWYINFFGVQAQAIMPYDESLSFFLPYVRQLDMSSNGKFVTASGSIVNYNTGLIVFGGVGATCENSFHQHFHQGTKITPCDLIAAVQSTQKQFLASHQNNLMTHFVAQSKAFMNGRPMERVETEMMQSGLDAEYVQRLLPHKVCLGNKPSNSILFRKLTPFCLGALMAMYEMKIFVQGTIWDINTFDCWSTELNQFYHDVVLEELTNDKDSNKFDSSTNALINFVKANRKKI